MPKVFRISLFFCAIILLACSKPEENVPLEGSANFETLIISSDSQDNFLVINETITFSVVGDDEVDYTNEAVFYVNQTEIPGASYVFDGEGSYSVYASYLGVNSNTLNFEVIGASERVVLIDNTKALRNQTI
ncbi:hypothetical protein, partial [Altibacter sp.]|uniref:hypothetical protein n=1 Tax=Altibacter sp. TaxID=2024823 RepID=UPI002588F9F4